MGQPCFSSATEAGELQTTPISADLTEAEWRDIQQHIHPATHVIIRLNSHRPHCRPLEAAALIAWCKTDYQSIDQSLEMYFCIAPFVQVSAGQSAPQITDKAIITQG